MDEALQKIGGKDAKAKTRSGTGAIAATRMNRWVRFELGMQIVQH